MDAKKKEFYEQKEKLEKLEQEHAIKFLGSQVFNMFCTVTKTKKNIVTEDRAPRDIDAVLKSLLDRCKVQEK